jgi:glycosyltransferase involved in cell wall biosynthesis
MKLSYAITVCNEVEETIKLITQLLNYKGKDSEIVVLLDTPKAPIELLEYLELQGEANHINLIESEFNNDFAHWKNFLNSQCKGEWIFQIDADELLNPELIVNLEDILDGNIDKDMIVVPRINIVNGLTDSHIQKWGWHVTDDGLINWPDLQSRLYKNVEYIRWENKVHEKITGFKTVAVLPTGFNLLHIKDIKRQEKQNDYYNTL